MLEIEILEINTIDKGVEVFARAWQDGIQIGFGHDGTVDVERFRIFNPPVLVQDPAGTIESISDILDPETSEVIEKKSVLYRYDPEEALLLALENSIYVMTNIFGNSAIVSGKRGNTTSTFYANTDDGRWFDGTATPSWDTIRSVATASSITKGGASDIPYYIRTNVSNYNGLLRSFFAFDTSTIPDTDVVSSATFSLYGNGTNINPTSHGSPSAAVVGWTPTNPVSVVTSDYNISNVGSRLCDTDISFSSWSTSGYNNYAFNAVGKSYVDKTSYTFIVGITDKDYDNVAPGISNNASYVNSFFADQTGTANDPKLVVEHAAGATYRYIPQIRPFAGL